MAPNEHDDSVEAIVLDRLDGSGLPSEAADLVVAALLGDDDLAEALSGERVTRPLLEPATDGAADRPGTYLRSITVEGFRGIGAPAALRLQPGPGLTLVAGRNGSGKSSFAEAMELALTGDNKRWSGRGVVWREGWRNLHASEPPRITVGLAADGQAGVLTVGRQWEPGAGLDDATAFAQAPGAPRQPLDALGWAKPLELYRPFLSYSELGALVAGRPSEMYDALQAILGLDQLIAAERRLNEARKRFDDENKAASRELPSVRELLKEHPDARARQAEAELAKRSWDLDAVEALAVGGGADGDALVSLLYQAAALTLPAAEDVSRAVSRLTTAERGVAGLAGTAADDARRLAGLLGTALDHHAAHPGEPCPVCAGRVLDAGWADRARAEVTRLTEAARAADAAHTELAAASQDLRDLVPAEPDVLLTGLAGELDTAAARNAWEQWTSLAAGATPVELAASARERFTALDAAVTRLGQDATSVLQQRSQAWQPAAAALATWAETARASQRAAITLGHLKKALAWLKDIGKEVRNARLEPFAKMSATVWETLRQESNVELGPIRLEGSATQRRVSLDVTVDGVPGTALSVMSQGELHALGLALFLPRATASGSPFRFLVIDDPVQSMDPAKVDGLARLLSEVAQDRQVIVFTHDDRLPEALRRLQLPATVWEVARREHSVVELRKNEDPVSRYLDDARALALTGKLPGDARAVVVAGFCRSALEAACHEVVRARRLASGDRHADIERDLTSAHTLRQMMALALLDDASRGEHVVPKLRSSYGQAAVDAFQAALSGTHGAYRGDLRSLVSDVTRLAAGLRK